VIVNFNKYLSIFLLLISLISFAGFGYYDHISDHFLRISDHSNQFILFYWLNSIVTFLAYYLGPWTIVPSVVLYTVHYLSFMRKNLFSLSLYQLSVWSFLFFLTGLFLPSFLSKPLFGLFSTFDTIYVYSSSISLFIFIIWCFDPTDYIYNGGKNLLVKFANNIHQYLLNLSSEISFVSLSKNKSTKFPENSQDSIVRPASNVSPQKNNQVLKIKPVESSIDSTLPGKVNHNSVIDDLKSKLPVITQKKSAKRSHKREVHFNNYFETVNLKPGKRNSVVANAPDNNYFQQIINRIEDKLLEFKIDGKIINILKGPVVDTFELELGSGVKVSKVTSSAEDLSLALYGAPIRIVYPMKGRTTVGIEVPRNPREVIYLDELLNTKEFKNTGDRLPLAMGKDAFGLPFIVDLVGMPHMLVAGATGAGKSVFINTILVSLLVKKTPEEMKLILIDPKQLELALYSTLPHLIMPVVTDAKRASLSLLWAVDEMERRYTILKELGVRNIDGYNEKLKSEPQSTVKIQHLFRDDQKSFKLPYIVIIVDEFADLILTKAGKEIENNICRLAAKARAAGIHLIIATQRPSVDVITGLIKSNFPTRVSFRVTTSIDSRTILNSVGAERLLGKGDMLYKHGVDTVRVHSSFVDEVEIEKLTYSLAQYETGFDEEVIEFLENGGEKEKDPYSFGSHLPSLKEDAGDELFDQAVEIVTECRSASASMLQRRLKVGYNRAANLVELMEEKGIVGPAQGSKPRKVLIASK